jgi:hypothetical protein
VHKETRGPTQCEDECEYDGARCGDRPGEERDLRRREVLDEEYCHQNGYEDERNGPEQAKQYSNSARVLVGDAAQSFATRQRMANLNRSAFLALIEVNGDGPAWGKVRKGARK